MKKDIFIDNCSAMNFCNPIKIEFAELYRWLIDENKNDNDKAYLVLSQFILKEYHDSNKSPKKIENILNIVDFLQKRGRTSPITTKEIEDFIKKKFTTGITKKLTSNKKDRNHIPAILLSNRKIALSEDNALKQDLTLFKIDVRSSSNPNDLKYDL